MKILNKYIFKQIFGPLIFSLLAFTAMFSGVSFLTLLKSAEKYHLSILLILEMLMYRLPEYAMQSAPIAVLLSTLLGLGNLTSHSETIAMRAGGFNYSKLLRPVLMMGLLISICGVMMNEYVVPQGLAAYEQVKNNAADNARNLVIEHYTKDFYSSENKIQKRIYAERYVPEKEQLQTVSILEYEQGKLTQIINAEVMFWGGKGWFFNDGLIYKVNEKNFYPIMVQKGYVAYDLQLSPKEIGADDSDPDQKSITELNEYISNLYPGSSERRRMLVDYHLKFSLPFAALIMAWMGAPLALRPQRRSGAAGFGLCIIFILIWYAFMGFGSFMARAGVVSPIFGAWLPNVVLALYGVYISIKTKS